MIRDDAEETSREPRPRAGLLREDPRGGAVSHPGELMRTCLNCHGPIPSGRRGHFCRAECGAEFRLRVIALTPRRLTRRINGR